MNTTTHTTTRDVDDDKEYDVDNKFDVAHDTNRSGSDGDDDNDVHYEDTMTTKAK